MTIDKLLNNKNAYVMLSAVALQALSRFLSLLSLTTNVDRSSPVKKDNPEEVMTTTCTSQPASILAVFW